MVSGALLFCVTVWGCCLQSHTVLLQVNYGVVKGIGAGSKQVKKECCCR